MRKQKITVRIQINSAENSIFLMNVIGYKIKKNNWSLITTSSTQKGTDSYEVFVIFYMTYIKDIM